MQTPKWIWKKRGRCLRLAQRNCTTMPDCSVQRLPTPSGWCQKAQRTNSALPRVQLTQSQPQHLLVQRSPQTQSMMQITTNLRIVKCRTGTVIVEIYEERWSPMTKTHNGEPLCKRQSRSGSVYNHAGLFGTKTADSNGESSGACTSTQSGEYLEVYDGSQKVGQRNQFSITSSETYTIPVDTMQNEETVSELTYTGGDISPSVVSVNGRQADIYLVGKSGSNRIPEHLPCCCDEGL